MSFCIYFKQTRATLKVKKLRNDDKESTIQKNVQISIIAPAVAFLVVVTRFRNIDFEQYNANVHLNLTVAALSL